MTELPDKIRQVIQDAALAKANLIDSRLLKKCQSPIETVMLYALWSSYCWGLNGQLELCETYEDVRKAASEHPRKLIICAQVQVESYRADFMVALSRFGNEPPALHAIECDGHDFHERTKEQAARDKARDREFARLGIHVFRFTGSEIWADANDCAFSACFPLFQECLQSKRRHEERLKKDHAP